MKSTPKVNSDTNLQAIPAGTCEQVSSVWLAPITTSKIRTAPAEAAEVISREIPAGKVKSILNGVCVDQPSSAPSAS